MDRTWDETIEVDSGLPPTRTGVVNGVSKPFRVEGDVLARTFSPGHVTRLARRVLSALAVLCLASGFGHDLEAQGCSQVFDRSERTVSALGTSEGPILVVSKSHAGSFTQGGIGAYTIGVTNNSDASTSGTVTVTDTLPAGLTPTAAGGGGWSCSIIGQTVTCTRSDTLTGFGSYAAIAVTVAVAGDAPAEVTNAAVVTGGASPSFCVEDPTTINPGVVTPPTITKEFSPAQIPLNGTSTLVFTLTYEGTSGTASLMAFTDTFPAGLQVAATPNAVNGCGGTFTAGAGATSVSLSLTGSLTPGVSCAVSVNVTAASPGVLYNTTGPVSSSEAGTGLPSNTATLVVCSPITVGPATLPGGSVGTAYAQTVAAAAGTAPYSFSQTAGVLPDGLGLNPGTGTISGTPTRTGLFTFTVTATDSQGCSGAATYIVTIGNSRPPRRRWGRRSTHPCSARP